MSVSKAKSYFNRLFSYDLSLSDSGKLPHPVPFYSKICRKSLAARKVSKGGNVIRRVINQRDAWYVFLIYESNELYSNLG